MASLQFTHPEFLVLLIAVPLLALTHWALFKFTKKKGMIFANFETLKRVTGEKILTKNLTVLVLRLLTITAIVLALAGPAVWYEGAQQRSDYVLALDTSASMTASDLSPNRLEAAKAAATRFVESINGSAEVGVITFSGVVTVEQPLTSDMGGVTNAIKRAQVKRISGTDIAGALVTGTNLLLPSERGRVVIVFTDGSNTAGAFADDPVQEGVAYAKDRQVVVHTVGVGRPDSGLSGYLPRIHNVSAVFNAQTLEYIANQTGGQALTAATDEQLSAAYQDLVSEGESALRSQDLSFGLFLLGLLFLFVEWGLTNTRFRLIP